MCSEIWMPGTLVEIGLYGPRILERRVHLQVEHVLMRRRAGHVDHDHRLGRLADAGLRFGAEDLRQAEPAHRQAADLEEIAPRKAVAKTSAGLCLGWSA